MLPSASTTSSPAEQLWVETRFLRYEYQKRFEVIRKIEMERFRLTTSKLFDEAGAGVSAAIGHPDMAELGRQTHEARSFAEMSSVIEKGLSKGGLVMRKEMDRDIPRIVRLLIGNPLIMKEMAEHVPDAGSYPPVSILIDECADGVQLSYDKMTSLLPPYGNRNALDVARDLDKKVEDLLRNAAACDVQLSEMVAHTFLEEGTSSCTGALWWSKQGANHD